MKQYSGLEIAVIGMAGKFPGAGDISCFWENLKNQVESISFFTEDELLEEGETRANVRNPAYVAARGVVDDKEYFDAAFFNYTPDEARLMDPQTRLFHECVWAALEDAGCNPQDGEGKIGLFAGASTNVNWMVYTELVNRDGSIDPFQAGQLSNAKFMATHVSYALNLCGPSVMMDTGCSTSLVAIQQACKSLLMAECSVAVAGGVNIRNSSKRGYVYTRGMTNSSDGHCRAFDAAADGTIGGEGAAVVVLKSLKNALKDGDHIYAIIKGNGINNDGNNKVGYTAPSVDGQAEAILMAHKWAKVQPESIGLIEAHGTATELGDPIEVEALNRAFGKSGTKYCAIGSVKTNVGHLDAAAGAAGFIKAALALHHREIPASLHFTSPNPKINFTDSPFYVSTRHAAWINDKFPLRAGVSSFGIGGTNAHVMLEEAPDKTVSPVSTLPQLLTVSAKTPAALKNNVERLRAFLAAQTDTNIADIAYTLQTGRVAFPYRAAVTADSVPAAIEALSSLLGKKNIAGGGPVREADRTRVVFMFPGQGAQYSQMCYDLYREVKVFREVADECFEIVKRLTKKDFRSIIFPGAAVEQENLLSQTLYAQPALFIIEYSLARTLMAWGIQPDRLIGHSFGEYVAACLSGVFSLSDALMLLTKRAALMQRAAQGKMLGISIPENELLGFLAANKEISLATVNSAELCVVSGSDAAIAEFSGLMESKGYSCKVIPGAAAYHSHLMDGILAEYKSELEKIKFGTQRFPIVSNLTGRIVPDTEIATPMYWVSHLRRTVRFSDGIDSLLLEPNVVFVEVGPGVELSSFVRASRQRRKEHKVFNLVRHENTEGNDCQHLLAGIGKLWTAGLQPSWKALHADQARQKVSLPSYAFDRMKYPVLVDAYKMLSVVGAEKTIVKEEEIAKWFYAPSWKLAPFVGVGDSLEFGCVLLFADSTGVGDELIGKFPQLVTVRIGTEWKEESAFSYCVNPNEKGDLKRLFERLAANRLMPDCIVHAWGVTGEQGFGLNEYFYSLVESVRACAVRKVVLITNDVYSVLDDVPTDPLKAMAPALLKVIGAEYGVNTCTIDMRGGIGDALYNEIIAKGTGRVISFSSGKRWELVYNTVPTTTNNLNHTGGVLITGGLGSFGVAVAEYLLEKGQTKIALVGRKDLSALPADRVEKLKALQSRGEVLYFGANVADPEEMRATISSVEGQWGAISGVFHAAGVVNEEMLKPVDDLDMTDFDVQFDAKVRGVQVLDALLGDKDLDFCMLVSSLSPIVGGVGFGAYGPANMYMDHYVRCGKQQGRLKNWISANIDGFELRHDAPLSINKGEIIETIDRVLSVRSLPQVIASASDLQIRLDKYIYRENQGQANTSVSDADIQSEVAGFTRLADEEDLDETQKSLLPLWRHFFGRPDIGLDDDFFETGGDSLKAITFSKRVNKAFGLEMTVMEFFRQATVRKLSGYIDSLKEKTSSAHSYVAIPRAAENETYPLSSAQRRLYFLYEFDPLNLAYVMPMFFRISGVLDKDRLNFAFRELLGRHESLRTAFVMSASGPVQKIVEVENAGIEVFQAEEKEVPAIIRDFVTPFNLTRAPLIRVGLVELAQDEFILMLSMHHIITDGVSGGVLLHDFITLYEGVELPVLPLQYKDYSVWQQSAVHQGEVEAQKRWWLRELDGVERPAAIPMDFKRPAVKSFEGSAIAFALDARETEALNALAKKNGASMYMLLLSMFNVLLAKLSNNEEVLVGTVTSGRPHADIEKIIGMFVNTLVLRNEVKGEESFTAFLATVKEKVLAALDNQDYQFEDLLTDLAIERDAGRTPLFDVMFSYDSFDDHDGVSLPGLNLTKYRADDLYAKFDLTLTIHDRPKEISFNVEYATSLFRAQTIERMIAYFRNIIAAVIGDPQTRISEIDILAGGYSKELLVDFNDTETPYAGHRLMHELFEERVQISPDNIAIVADGRSYSYSWLNEAANRLAHFLREKGVRRESAVVVIMERNIEMMVALFGILKAGGKYVPVEPYIPGNRVIEIGRSVEATFLITDTASSERAMEAFRQVCAEPVMLTLDKALDKELQNYEPTNPERCNSSLDLAYVIFTSGSTGKPKGVAVQHRPVINLIEWITKTYQVGSRDKLLFVSSISFDLSVYDIFGILAAGGQVRIANRSELEEPATLADIVVNEGITFWDSAPAMLQQIVPMLEKRREGIAERGKLRISFLSGDWIPLNMPVQMKGLFAGMRFVALGGATEATVWSNFYEVEKVEESWNSIPYGKPIQNARYLVLDKYLHLCPIGVAGTLYIGGQCLAAGYFNDRELSDRKFIPSPFNKGEKLYDTGDMARWFSDGNIEFLGRKDSQVKIRGYRIELGEIESSLLKFPGVDQVLAQVIEKSKYDKAICAYYISAGALPEEELREFLGRDLPPYMVPKYFVHLHEMPVTVNGKLDRKRLPAPQQSRNGGAQKIAETATQQALIGIWANLLHVESNVIGPEDDFFELGGHSILAVHLMNNIQQQLGVTVKLRQIFDHPTVRRQAVLVDDLIKKTVAVEMIAGMDREAVMPYAAVGEKEYYVCSPAQERLFYEQWVNKDTLAYNVAGCFEVRGLFDAERARGCFQALVDRHEGLRTSFHLVNETVVQKIHSTVDVNFSDSGLDLHSFVRPFDLGESSLFRCGLVQADGRVWLLIDIHHIVCDGLSMNILMNEFRKLYQGKELEPLTLRYVDYAEAQKAPASAPAQKGQREFWQRQLTGGWPALQLQVSQPADDEDIYPAGVSRLELSGESYGRIKRLLADANVSGFMFFLSVYYILLSRMSGNADIVIATDTVGRTHPALKDIVGTFINLLPLRANVQTDEAYRNFLQKIRQTVLDGFENQDFPFDEMLSIVRESTGLQKPSIEVHFTYAGYIDRDGADVGLEFIPLKPEGSETTQYGFKVEVSEDNGKFVLLFIYSRALYTEDIISLFTQYYRNIMEAILQDGWVRIGDIEMENMPVLPLADKVGKL